MGLSECAIFDQTMKGVLVLLAVVICTAHSVSPPNMPETFYANVRNLATSYVHVTVYGVTYALFRCGRSSMCLYVTGTCIFFNFKHCFIIVSAC